MIEIFNKVVTIRFWDPGTDSVYDKEVNLMDLIEDPTYYNVFDIGLEMMNILREVRGFPPIDRSMVAV